MLGGFFPTLPYWLGGLLTVVALVHFFVTRPDTYWVFVILFLGPLGSAVYLAVHVVGPLFAGGGGIENRLRLTFAESRRLRELEHKVEEIDLPRDRAELGELLFRKGRFDRAETLLRSAYEQHDEPETGFWLALTLEKLGRPADAAAVLEPIVARDPRFKFGDAALAHARALAAAGKRQPALDAFRRVLAQSSVTEARVRYGLLLAETGDTDAARRELETAVREAKGLPRFNLRRARPYVRQARAWLAGRH